MSENDYYQPIASRCLAFLWRRLPIKELDRIRALVEKRFIPKIGEDQYPTDETIAVEEAFGDSDQAEKQVEFAIRHAEWAVFELKRAKREYAKHQGHRYRGDAREVRITVRKGTPHKQRPRST
jgi:hypothetical protein